MKEQVKELYISAVTNEMSPDDFYTQLDLILKTPKNNLVEELLQDIMDINGVTSKQLKNHKSRKRELVIVRQWHLFMLKRIGKLSLSTAGSLYGKDHATVMHAIKSICNLREFDRNFQYTYEEVIAKLEKADNRIFVYDQSFKGNLWPKDLENL